MISKLILPSNFFRNVRHVYSYQCSLFKLKYGKDYIILINEVFAEDFIEKRCEFLGEIYGVAADALLDNLYLEEVTTLYRETTG